MYFGEAIIIVKKKIAEFSDIELGILNKKTIEFEYGWMFFYQSMEYIETGDLNKIVGGNAPIIFDKFESKVYITGTGKESAYYLKKYKEFKSIFKLIE